MDYSPINFRRISWFIYDIKLDSWIDLISVRLYQNQQQLTIGAYR